MLQKSIPLIVLIVTFFLGAFFSHNFDIFSGRLGNRIETLDDKINELVQRNNELEDKMANMETGSIEIDGFAHDLESRVIDLEDNMKK